MLGELEFTLICPSKNNLNFILNFLAIESKRLSTPSKNLVFLVIETAPYTVLYYLRKSTQLCSHKWFSVNTFVK